MTRTLVNITVIKYKSTDKTADGTFLYFSFFGDGIALPSQRHTAVCKIVLAGGKYKLTGLCGPLCVSTLANYSRKPWMLSLQALKCRSLYLFNLLTCLLWTELCDILRFPNHDPTRSPKWHSYISPQHQVLAQYPRVTGLQRWRSAYRAVISSHISSCFPISRGTCVNFLPEETAFEGLLLDLLVKALE